MGKSTHYIWLRWVDSIGRFRLLSRKTNRPHAVQKYTKLQCFKKSPVYYFHTWVPILLRRQRNSCLSTRSIFLDRNLRLHLERKFTISPPIIKGNEVNDKFFIYTHLLLRPKFF